jgi:hypothetical protein
MKRIFLKNRINDKNAVIKKPTLTVITWKEFIAIINHILSSVEIILAVTELRKDHHVEIDSCDTTAENAEHGLIRVGYGNDSCLNYGGCYVGMYWG